MSDPVRYNPDAPQHHFDDGTETHVMSLDFLREQVAELRRLSSHRCRCGHLDINHPDLNLDALGNCYQCACIEFVGSQIGSHKP